MIEIVVKEQIFHVRLLLARQVPLLHLNLVVLIFQQLHLLLSDESLLLLVVVEGALISFEAFLFFAGKSFVVQGMELLLFPAMTKLA
jgi:hypothetical protein